VVDLKIALVCTEKLPVPPVAGGAIQMYIDGILPYLSVRHDITVYCVNTPACLMKRSVKMCGM
jgi:spore coat protein SA